MKAVGFHKLASESLFLHFGHKTNILDKPLAMKLIVLSLLLGGIASANGGTCKAKKLREGFEDLQSQGGEILDEVADIKAEVADLKAQVAEIKSLVEFIASEATVWLPLARRVRHL